MEGHIARIPFFQFSIRTMVFVAHASVYGCLLLHPCLAFSLLGRVDGKSFSVAWKTEYGSTLDVHSLIACYFRILYMFDFSCFQ